MNYRKRPRMCWRGVKHVSKQEITISRIYNYKVRVLYYFYLALFCRKSRLYFGGRRAIPTACGGRSTIGVVVAFRLVHSVHTAVHWQRIVAVGSTNSPITVLIHVHKASSSRTQHRDVTAVLPLLFIQPLYDSHYGLCHNTDYNIIYLS